MREGVTLSKQKVKVGEKQYVYYQLRWYGADGNHHHLDTLVACDFFSKSVWTPLGKRMAFCLMFIHLGTRKVFVSPATYHPTRDWVNQQAKNVAMWINDEGLD